MLPKHFKYPFYFTKQNEKLLTCRSCTWVHQSHPALKFSASSVETTQSHPPRSSMQLSPTLSPPKRLVSLLFQRFGSCCRVFSQKSSISSSSDTQGRSHSRLQVIMCCFNCYTLRPYLKISVALAIALNTVIVHLQLPKLQQQQLWVMSMLCRHLPLSQILPNASRLRVHLFILLMLWLMTGVAKRLVLVIERFVRAEDFYHRLRLDCFYSILFAICICVTLFGWQRWGLAVGS